jgi:hypothetical protein
MFIKSWTIIQLPATVILSTDTLLSGVSNDVDKNQLIGYVKEIEKPEKRNSKSGQSHRCLLCYGNWGRTRDGYDDFYDYLFNNLTYPEEAKDKGVEGYCQGKICGR